MSNKTESSNSIKNKNMFNEEIKSENKSIVSLNINDPINKTMTIAKLSCNVNDIADIRTAIVLANDLISLGYHVDKDGLLNAIGNQLFNS